MTKYGLSANRCLLALIIVLGAALDLYCLTSQAFWRDEVTGVAVAQSPWPVFVRLAYGYESGTALYHTLLRSWLALGDSPFTVRLLSVIFAVAALPTLYALGARLFTVRVGLVAALLLAVNAFFIQYAQEARNYTLTVFLALVSWLFMLDCVRQPSPARAFAYIITTTLAVYSHGLAILTLPAQLTALLLLRPEPTTRNRIVLDMGAVGLFVIPELLMMRSAAAGELNWVAGWAGRPNLGTLEDLIVSFVGVVQAWAVVASVRHSLEALYGLGFLLAVVEFVSGLRKGEEEARSYVVTGAALIVPVALLMGESQIQPLFIARYVLICLPFFTLLAASGLCRLRPGLLLGAAVALIAILDLSADWTYYTHPSKPDWKGAVHYLAANARTDDKLILSPAYCRWEYDYNLRRFGDPAKSPEIVYPRWDSSFKVRGLYIYSATMLGDNPIFASTLSRSYKRLWTITCDIDDNSKARVVEQIPQCGSFSMRYFRRISVILCTDHLASSTDSSGVLFRTP